jgi:hypothetical protein
MTYANGDVYTGKWKKGEKVFTFTAGVDTGLEVGIETAEETEEGQQQQQQQVMEVL